jgi:hypothetical protein
MGSFGRQLGWWTRPLSALLGVCLVGLWALPAAAQTVVNVIDGPSLVAAITQVDSNASARYVINLQNNITLSGAPQIRSRRSTLQAQRLLTATASR